MANKKVCEIKICPKCGRGYSGRPALSREDNITLICPDCGTREALEAVFHSSKDDQDRILEAIHRGGC